MKLARSNSFKYSPALTKGLLLDFIQCDDVFNLSFHLSYTVCLSLCPPPPVSPLSASHFDITGVYI